MERARAVGTRNCDPGDGTTAEGTRRKRAGEMGRGDGEVSRTLGLLEEQADVADARWYRLPSSYQQDFVCKRMRSKLVYHFPSPG
jgi:hypothetical protein